MPGGGPDLPDLLLAGDAGPPLRGLRLPDVRRQLRGGRESPRRVPRPAPRQQTRVQRGRDRGLPLHPAAQVSRYLKYLLHSVDISITKVLKLNRKKCI